MSRYLGPKHRLCRREGVKLCDSPKCPVVRRNYPPGVHGPKGYRRLTPFGEQLREKQKAKRLYGVLERQFRTYYKNAIRMKGDTGLFIIQMLERRLDNVIYRSGFSETRPQARQMVSHSFFLINGKPINIPSYQVSPKDEITIKSSKLKLKIFSDLEKNLQKHEPPEWLHLDVKTKTIKVISLPKVDSEKQLFEVKSIVESYSR